MFKAKLSDPIHGTAEATAETAEAAVEQAFRALAESWMHEDDKRRWPDDSPMFDGDINEDGEVWWDDRKPVLLGTVRPVPVFVVKRYDSETRDWTDSDVEGPYDTVEQAEEDFGEENVRVVVPGRVFSLHEDEREDGALVGLLVAAGL